VIYTNMGFNFARQLNRLVLEGQKHFFALKKRRTQLHKFLVKTGQNESKEVQRARSWQGFPE
jgi:hypothetical protein